MSIIERQLQLCLNKLQQWATGNGCCQNILHITVYDNKYMKLFDGRPNAIRTFGLPIEQLLPASNIQILEILETPSYFILPPCCIKPSKIVLDLVHLKKDRPDASIYQQLFLEIRDGYRGYIPV